MRLIDADKAVENIDEWLDSVGYATVGKGLSYYGELIGCVDEAPTITPSGWVSVEERLPDTAGEFLVVYHPCYWDNVSAEICIGIDSFRGKTAWAKRKYQRVTHWMPLPEPPKED